MIKCDKCEHIEYRENQTYVKCSLPEVPKDYFEERYYELEQHCYYFKKLKVRK